ncbi:nucleolar complex protein 4 homolog [Diadema antillarum]|uniref:nucleolar complex protein 4 homolog n=1 Tax=Diadema antillarum TaxID=105358 RepID=UPI003A875D8D
MAEHVDSKEKPPRIEKKKIGSRIKQMTKDALASNGQKENILEILEYLKSEDKDAVKAATQATNKIFSTLLTRDAMKSSSSSSSKPSLVDKDPQSTPLSDDEKHRSWLRAKYSDAIKCLSRVVGAVPGSRIAQDLALSTLMKFVVQESHHPLKVDPNNAYSFPAHIITLLLPQLLSQKVVMSELIGQFKEHMAYDDVRHHALQHLYRHISRVAWVKLSQAEITVACNNIVLLLNTVSMPTDDESINNFLGVAPDPEDHVKITSVKEHQRVFTNTWIAFLRLPLPTSVYKQILVNIHENVMPHMTSPLLLTDFLTASYDIGGAISLLALNGIFILVNEYNLEYPEFFSKFYALFEPSVFHVKYKARFFHLADLFLSSTHLPAYVVAAFAKRLSRLSLTAPPQALLMIVPFVCNLLMRHPSCKVLIHRPDGPREVSGDPYRMEEPDPAKSRALESSLWELQTLRSHYHPGVSNSAASLERPLPKMEWDMAEYLELTVQEMVAKETKKKMKTMPLEFEPPRGLLGGGQDLFDGRFWEF